jgi:hypothetical protein
MLERAVGDVLTTILCEILELIDPAGESSIMIFGLAFPKLVGRILSLRPASYARIYWICPRPFPPWIAEGVNESALFGALSSGFGTEWDDETIVRTSSVTVSNPGASLYIQQLATSNIVVPFDVSRYVWLQTGLCEALLPREIVVAAGQVHNHIGAPYTGEPEETLRPLCEPQFPANEYGVLPRQRKGGLPVWDINWRSTSLDEQ